MKLGAIDAVVAESEREATITITRPDGEPYRAADGTECTITFTGDQSRTYRAERERIRRRALNSRKSKVDPKDVDRNRIDIAAAAVTRWSGWEGDDDQPAACTPENVKRLLKAEHILVQLEEGIASHSDFFTSASPS